ncbi:PREDICTED: uncharacterized protein LOC109586491 [Amphimedon queenslandica]|uniref:Death domain-containing protein n=1 Tax=Amphimedon queenslandica TaxID=400682 RepID=A0AAN0JN54_AMPQE|nr:PREDICTED: uncharacterized protein LOC109586491 [Amphimedon queenslandica]|eukprot:XP_019858246.1 PREDICTED: uncharacterized protein LOC109586491 [Amphimedon queenslandica]
MYSVVRDLEVLRRHLESKHKSSIEYDDVVDSFKFIQPNRTLELTLHTTQQAGWTVNPTRNPMKLFQSRVEKFPLTPSYATCSVSVYAEIGVTKKPLHCPIELTGIDPPIIIYIDRSPPLLSINSSSTAAAATNRQSDREHQNASRYSLTTKDLHEVLNDLRRGGFSDGSYFELGLELGLHHRTLNNIKSDNMASVDHLRECISKWLMRLDDVDKRGGANWTTLCNAVEKMNRAAADSIRAKHNILASQPIEQSCPQNDVEPDTQNTGESTSNEGVEGEGETGGEPLHEEGNEEQDNERVEESKDHEEPRHEEATAPIPRTEISSDFNSKVVVSTGIVENMAYAGLVYYEKKEAEDLVTYTAAKDLNALLEFIDKRHSQAEVGQNILFRFKDHEGCIELKFDGPQEKTCTGWTIEPHLKPCRFLRFDVDKFGEANYPLPSRCLISVYGSPGAVPSLHYSIPLDGVADPKTLFIHRSLRTTPSLTNPTTPSSSSNVVDESTLVSEASKLILTQ